MRRDACRVQAVVSVCVQGSRSAALRLEPGSARFYTRLIRSTPFDLRLALPDEAGPAVSLAPADDGSERPGSR